MPENPGAQSLGLLGKRGSRSTCLGFQGWAHGWLPGLRGPCLWRLPWCVVASRLVVNYCVRPTAAKVVSSGVAGPSPLRTGHSPTRVSCSHGCLVCAGSVLLRTAQGLFSAPQRPCGPWKGSQELLGRALGTGAARICHAPPGLGSRSLRPRPRV